MALVRVVARECGDRAATVLEKHLREKSVASWAAAGIEGWGPDGVGVGAGVGGGGGGGGAAVGGGVGGGEVAVTAGSKVLGQADALLEELAVLTQHTESYDRFVKFLVEEVRFKVVCGAGVGVGDGGIRDERGERGGRGSVHLNFVLHHPFATLSVTMRGAERLRDETDGTMLDVVECCRPTGQFCAT